MPLHLAPHQCFDGSPESCTGFLKQRSLAFELQSTELVSGRVARASSLPLSSSSPAPEKRLMQNCGARDTDIHSPPVAVTPGLPPDYLDLEKNIAFQPPHRPWDCAIDLMSGITPPLLSFNLARRRSGTFPCVCLPSGPSSILTVIGSQLQYFEEHSDLLPVNVPQWFSLSPPSCWATPTPIIVPHFFLHTCVLLATSMPVDIYS
ncbi:hypothetical protein DPEC_G00334870 [Dallia pectoralis]|uniref:Uncharacterized protein n=1 Tax=Dallia pectoralis TaxID=75939 RepID=A0ACC2F6T3_DALPE|nr:hypothetical protein DPEC_G00334870 [Dallia pectoralis]